VFIVLAPSCVVTPPVIPALNQLEISANFRLRCCAIFSQIPAVEKQESRQQSGIA
jgi:hypothetical protein